jgi:hypothetical protein
VRVIGSRSIRAAMPSGTPAGTLAPAGDPGTCGWGNSGMDPPSDGQSHRETAHHDVEGLV